MNGNPTNLAKDENGNSFSMRKITFWELYGVKRFPYRGKRKYTPLLSQSFDGGMIISNDVFGLTIRQFERMYKACLERRKTHEQWIINLRYPDKSSNEYLEYLENCTDCHKDHLVWLRNNPSQKCLFEHLVNTVGSEIDIRKRQRLCIIGDMIHDAGVPDFSKMFSGSLSEGMDLPGSDIDIMYLSGRIEVIQNVNNVKHPVNRATVVMETDMNNPGFTRLRLVAQPEREPFFRVQCFNCPPGTCTGERIYLDTYSFKDFWIKTMGGTVFVHGPCLSNKSQTIDKAFCIRSKYLPHNAIPWASRQRQQWPPNFIIDRIINYGCLIVPIGPKNMSDSNLLWRLSFSVAEKILVHSFNFTQLLCYGLLKLTLKCIVNTNNAAKELMCSYFLKTTLFWVSEESDIETFQLSKLYYCFSLCLHKLISWVKIAYCPNYFIPEHNMFLGKINQSNNYILLVVLESIKFGGIGGLITSLFKPDNENPCLVSTDSQSQSIMLDFLFYRINDESHTMECGMDILNWYKRLALTKSLLTSESSTFIIDVCKNHYAEISISLAQLLPSPNTKGNKYNIHTCYHRHLHNGIKTDAVSGWLFYASFYYVTGQYNVTLKLLDYVMSRCPPYMMFTCKEPKYGQRIIYRQNIHSSMTLNDRMKMAIIRNVRYCRNSSLIPEELQLEVETREKDIPPVVMSHCLRFLCYHHLDDLLNRQKSLRDLYLTVKQKYLIHFNDLSNSITILGLCYEISGAKDTACQCYEEALQCDNGVYSTAQIRKSKLDGSYC